MSTHLRSADALKLTQAAQKRGTRSKLCVTGHEEGDIRVSWLKQHLVHMLLHHLLAGHCYLLDIYTASPGRNTGANDDACKQHFKQVTHAFSRTGSEQPREVRSTAVMLSLRERREGRPPRRSWSSCSRPRWWPSSQNPPNPNPQPQIPDHTLTSHGSI